MSDDIRHDFVGSIAKIIEVIERLRNAREYKRLKLFSDVISPMMEQFEKTHKDFLLVISTIVPLCIKMEASLRSRNNDIDNIIKEFEDGVRIADQKMQEGRLERRKLYEEARARGTLMERQTKDIIKNIEASSMKMLLILSDTEKKYLVEFCMLMASYFQVSENLTQMYNHDLRYDLSRLKFMIHNINRMGSDGDAITDLQLIREKFEMSERHFEAAFALTASKFATIRAMLKQ